MLSILRLPLRDEKDFIVSPFARTIEIHVPRPCNNHFWILGFGDNRDFLKLNKRK